MLNKKFIEKLKKDYVAHEIERRKIISLTNVVLHDSKRAIFALHRDNVKEAEAGLEEVEKVLKKIEKDFGFARISEEGAYKAGVEEYVEAKMLYFVVTGKRVDKIPGLTIGAESYLGGICDLTGEMVRRATNEGAHGNFEAVEKIKKNINDIMAELVTFDMTGYLRTKYDQARTNLRKIEQISYEINIRKK